MESMLMTDPVERSTMWAPTARQKPTTLSRLSSIARPIPREAPVTSAALPAREKGFVLTSIAQARSHDQACQAQQQDRSPCSRSGQPIRAQGGRGRTPPLPENQPVRWDVIAGVYG